MSLFLYLKLYSFVPSNFICYLSELYLVGEQCYTIFSFFYYNNNVPPFYTRTHTHHDNIYRFIVLSIFLTFLYIKRKGNLNNDKNNKIKCLYPKIPVVLSLFFFFCLEETHLLLIVALLTRIYVNKNNEKKKSLFPLLSSCVSSCAEIFGEWKTICEGEKM